MWCILMQMHQSDAQLNVPFLVRHASVFDERGVLDTNDFVVCQKILPILKAK